MTSKPPTSTNAPDYFPLARKIARRIAWTPSDEEDLVQEGILALHKALQKTPTPEEPAGFASVVLSRAMREYYPKRKGDGSLPPSFDLLFDSPSLNDPDISLSGLSASAGAIDPLDDLDIAEYLADLESRCGRQARWAAQNLIAPGEQFGGWLLIELAEKQKQMAADPSIRRRGTETIRISHRQIQEALGLSVPRWTKLLEEIRKFTREWLREQGSSFPELPGDNPLLRAMPKN